MQRQNAQANHTAENGQEWIISAGGYKASIVQRGATLRELSVGDRPLILSFSADQPVPDYRGIIAAPWPNRLADGVYNWDGRKYQAPINEADRHTALHGLVDTQLWELTELSQTGVVLHLKIPAGEAYPSDVELTVEYNLDDDGLHTTVTATNSGHTSAPFGVCPHPYLLAGDAPLNEWTLEVPAESFLEVTEDRLLPVDLASVDGHSFDFRQAKVIGNIELDHAFTNFHAEDGGHSTLTLTDPSGSFVGMSWDESCPWLQIHTADKSDPSLSRLGLAVEPMTCPPDAFNSGTDVVELAPGALYVTGWSIFGC